MNAPARRQNGNCPNGGVFYKCRNGFEGCCLEDPCNPGATCPEAKDRTPGRYTPLHSSSQGTTATTTSSLQVPTSVLPLTTSTFSSAAPSTTTSAPLYTKLITIVHSPTVAAVYPGTGTPQFPVSAIVGTVVGALGLSGLVLFLFICLRRRKVEKVYKAPHYPSPYIGSDMSPQLKSTHKLTFRRSFDVVQQLDSREIGAGPEFGMRGPSQFAELPAEPVR